MLISISAKTPRQICRDPEIIIFDEATSSLDSRTEEKIQKALEQELTKKTLIFIAHRVSTLKNVETIYVFKEGSIIEKGTYEDLIKRTDSVFSQLYNLQVDKRRPS
jgi:ABC-type multidrug transport system fused ATPase/permease subunit